MTLKFLCQLAPVVLLSGNLFAGPIITGFGTSETNPFNIAADFTVPWTGTQTATTVSIVNVSNEMGGIFATLDTPIDISGSTVALELTGFSTMPPTPLVDQFRITLYDSASNSLSYDFSWSSFSGVTPQTVSASLIASSGTFNGTVISWETTLFGAGDTVSFTFDTLQASAVPEPGTTSCLLAGGLVGFILLKRRRHALLAIAP
jgi:PEP-CTERM motif